MYMIQLYIYVCLYVCVFRYGVAPPHRCRRAEVPSAWSGTHSFLGMFRFVMDFAQVWSPS